METIVKSSQVSRKRHFNLNCRHLTTMDFMRPQPVYYRRLIPGQSIKVESNVFSRLSDMPCPTFGEASLRVLGFFIPYRTVWNNFNNFIAGTPTPSSGSSVTSYTTCRYFANADMVICLLRNYGSRVNAPSDTNYDIYVGADFEPSTSPDPVISNTYWKLNPRGRWLYKVLQSLGYQLNFSSTDPDLDYNALDLLSFLRVYVDWLYSNHDVSDLLYSKILHLLEVNSASAVTSAIVDLFRLVDYFDMTLYESNRFVDSFDNIIGPNNNNANPTYKVPVTTGRNTSSGFVEQYVLNNVPTTTSYNKGISEQPALVSGENPNNYALSSVTTNMLQTLQAMSAYVRRNQLAGARAYERLYALFGIKPDTDVFSRSYFLGEYDVPLQVSDVMSTASTSDAQLGSYAGKGFFVDLEANNGVFEFNNDTTDFGVFMLVAFIQPKVMYPWGVDAMQKQLSRLQFYTGDYDSIGCEPIGADELWLPEHTDLGRNFIDMQNVTFAFTPRYSVYKTARDFLTGDFRLNSMNQAGVNSPQWHFARYFDVSTDGAYQVSDDFHINKDFRLGSDASQYNRIFYYTGAGDHFVCQFLFKVDSYANMQPLYKFDDFEHEDEHGDVKVQLEGIEK